CVTGLSSCLVGERFQRSPDTITKYFKRMLFFFSSNPFYGSQIVFPTHETPISEKILNDPRFRFFDQCIGAVDGTHIQAFVPPEEHFHMCNRK
ncbi:hypothetical protein CY34DRAFT_28697, partial [Suillus luteus UH-Slu-Lm8-n1]